MGEQDQGGSTDAAEAPLSLATQASTRDFVAEVFDAIVERLAHRVDDVARFCEATCSFQSWFMWESLAALATHAGGGSGCTVRPRPPYTEVGVPGSRDVADLLVCDVATGNRVLIELVVIHDWSSNKWIDNLDGATLRLSRSLEPSLVPLQVVVTASLAAPIDVNPLWQQWLGMSRIWRRPTSLRRSMPFGAVGQLSVQGWVLGG